MQKQDTQIYSVALCDHDKAGKVPSADLYVSNFTQFHSAWFNLNIELWGTRGIGNVHLQPETADKCVFLASANNSRDTCTFKKAVT